MLHRGPSVRFHHTKADSDPSLVADAKTHAEGVGASGSGARTRPSRHRSAQTAEGNPAPWSVVEQQLQQQRGAPTARADRSGSGEHGAGVELSKELRDRAAMGVRWTGVKPFAQHSTATKAMIAVPLAALSATPVAPVPSSHTGSSGVLNVARLGSPRRQTHFVSPFAAAQAARRAAAQVARREAASSWLMEAPGSGAASAAAGAGSTSSRRREQRLVVHASAEAGGQGSDPEQAELQPRVPPNPRLTVPHLPLHLLLSPDELDLAAAAAATTDRPRLPSDEARAASASADGRAATGAAPRVPDAQIIFANFQRWLAGQRQGRLDHEQAAAAVAAAEADAARVQPASSFSRDADSKALRRIESRQQRSAQRAQREGTAHTDPIAADGIVPSSDGASVEDAPAIAAASADPPSDAADVPSPGPEDGADPLDASEPEPDAGADTAASADDDDETSTFGGPFVPSLYSYPRLHFSPEHASSGSGGATGRAPPVKFQAHLVEVRSYPEMQAVWAAFVEHMGDNNARASASDGAVRNRVFAFRIEQPSDSTDAETRGRGAVRTEEKNHESGSPSTSPSVAHGFEDGTDRGSGAKLLHLLESHALTNVMLLVTESGAGGGAASIGAAATGPGGPGGPLPSASVRAFRHACMLRTAKIMLQDYVRIVALAALHESSHNVRRMDQQAQEALLQQHQTQQIQMQPYLTNGQPYSHGNDEERQAEQRLTLHPAASDPSFTDPPELPAVTLYTLPLHGSSPVPFGSGIVGTGEGYFSSRAQALLHPHPHPHPPFPVYMCVDGASATRRRLPTLTTADEETLRGEILQLLSGHAYFVMSASNLSRDGGAHRPHFMALWRAFMTLIHCNQEAPDLQYLADRTPLRDTERRGFGEAGFAAQVAAAEASGPSTQTGAAGRMCGSMRPDGRAALRMEQKMRALNQGVDALMLDGFHAADDDGNGNGSPGRRRGRGRSRSRSLERGAGVFRAEEHMDRNGARGLNLRGGSGFAGSPGWKGYPAHDAPAAPAAGASRAPPGPQSRAQRTQAKIASLCAAEEDSSELASQALLQRFETARRKTLLHTAASVAAAQAASHGSDSIHSQRGRVANMDAPGSTAAVWLELQRARSIVPEYRVPSFTLLYTQQLQLVYLFKSKMLASRLSRASLRQMADRYDERGPVASSSGAGAGAGGAPPFLLRILLLSVGILLRWRSLHWKGLCHYLRGEVLCTVLSPFLLQDQSALAAYIRAQEDAGAYLPPPLPAERLARNVLEREQMEARVAEFERTYMRATRGAILRSGGGAPIPSRSLGGIGGSGAPRDLMVHLMSMDVQHMSAQQYTQVRTLFNEPTLTRHHLLTLLPAPFHAEAIVLFDWVLLTMRAYNVWKSCRMAFVEEVTPEEKRMQQRQQQQQQAAHAMAHQQAQCGSNALSYEQAHDMSLSNIGRSTHSHGHSHAQGHAPSSGNHSARGRVHTDVVDAQTDSAPMSPPQSFGPRRPLSSAGGVRPWSARAGSRPSSASSLTQRSHGAEANATARASSIPLRAPPAAAAAARNLVSLHASERPAATHTDELLSGWLMQSATATPRLPGTPSHLDDAPSRMMG